MNGQPPGTPIPDELQKAHDFYTKLQGWSAKTKDALTAYDNLNSNGFCTQWEGVSFAVNELLGLMPSF